MGGDVLEADLLSLVKNHLELHCVVMYRTCTNGTNISIFLLISLTVTFQSVLSTVETHLTFLLVKKFKMTTSWYFLWS